MATCFDNLVGMRTLCESSGPQPLYYIDDVEGIDQKRLSDLANERDSSGKGLFARLLDSSIRIMQGDIETLIPPRYSITNNQLANLCSSCTWSGFYQSASMAGTGIIIKNESHSQFAELIISSLRCKINNTGSFTFFITDGVVTTNYTTAFVAGQEITFNLTQPFRTKQPAVRIGFTNTSVILGQIICPTNSSCGCGSTPAAVPSEVKIVGLHLGVETATQYGFLACVKLACSYDEIVCSLVQSSPRLFALTLLQLLASKVFATNATSQRVNRTAGTETEEKKEMTEVFKGYYNDRLKGNTKKNILGISQAISTNLSQLQDKCITCSSPLGIAWAAG